MGRIKDHFFDEINNDDDGYDKYLEDLQILRHEAEYHIDAYYEQGMDIKDLFEHIWHSSTEILNGLEVQVVIDSNDAIHISSGSAGYVDFQIDPVGMKLPIKCWIHTHPFGSAYFSSVDIRTVSIWDTNMQNAIVLGGYNHWGSWTNNSPNELTIYVNGKEDRIQKWAGEEEE